MSDQFDIDQLLEEMFAEDYEISSILDAPVIPESFAANNITVPLDGETYNINRDSVAYDPGTEVLRVRNIYDQHMATMAEREKRIQEIKDTIETERKKYNELVYTLTQERNGIDASLTEERARKREYERQVKDAEARLRIALESEKIRLEFAARSAELDAKIANAPRRDKALPHQLDGAKLIATADGRAILADKPGLGKTLESLMVADMMGAKKVLIIVPDDVVGNFYREVKHWTPDRTTFHIGKMPKAQRNPLLDIAKGMDEFTVIVNYSAWRKDNSLLTKLVDLHFDMVVMDEAHTMKEVKTNAFRGAQKIVLAENSCPRCRKNIQQIHIGVDKRNELRATGNRQLYTFSYHDAYWQCVGDDVTSDSPIPEEYIVNRGCGWNQIEDIENGVKREAGYLRSVQIVIPMTGTPILNKPTDLYPLLSLIWPEKFNDVHDFERMYCEKNQYSGRWQFKPGGLKRLTNELAGRYVARDRKTAGVILPKQDLVIHNIELDEKQYPQQARVISDLTKHAMVALAEGTIKAPVLYTIALITRKRQANVWPAGIEFKNGEGLVVFSVGDEVRESIKLDRILLPADRSESGDAEGLVADFTAGGDLTNGERVVIFSQFKQPLKELERRIAEAGISVVRLDGDTDKATHEAIEIDFDRKYSDQPGYEIKWQVLLANYRAGGQSLNFTGATQVIMLDEEWNPGKEEQAANRVDRIGQTEESTVHILRIDGTIDDWMADLINEKRNVVEGFASNINLANDLLDAMRRGEVK